MNIINENKEKSKRYLPHDIKTRENAVKTYRNGNSISYVLRKYHISRTSLYRWNKAYDGTLESLMDKSHRPHSPHPNAHTKEEIKWIKDLLKRHKNDNLTLGKIWYKLRINKGYKRNIGSLYRVMRKLGYYKQINITGTSKYIPKKYFTSSMLGEKWQIDVKYVTSICLSDKVPLDKKYYQYTCIDEAARERFLYWYDEHTPANTVDFVKRCISYFEYKPSEIQTDNGTEFTWNQSKMKKLHPLDDLCLKLDIDHHKIRPRTPRHNGKVERSHRNDNERFYNTLIINNLEDLREKGKAYLERSNKIPMACLNYLTPLEKRKELIVSLLVQHNTFISLVNGK